MARALPRKTFLFLLWSLLLLSVVSFAKEKKFTLDDLAPDQLDVGMAEVHEKADEILEQARLLAKTRGTKLTDEIIKILDGKLQRDVRAYISPDGKVRIVDSHHKVMAALELMKRENIPRKKILFEAELVKDFSGKSWAEYAKYREKNDPTYIPERVRGSLDQEGITEFYEHLPTNFNEIKNSPMRSATGKLFEDLSLKGSYFKPFIQFQIGEKLTAMGIQVKEGEEFSAETQNQIHKAIFDGAESNPLYQFIEQAALPARKAAVAADMANGALLSNTKTVAEHTSDGVAGGVAGVCSENFAKLSLSEMKLPALRLPEDGKLFTKLIAGAKEKFAKRVDINHLENILKKLEQNADLSKEDQSFLKEARKSSLTLRSAIKLLGSEDSKEELGPFRRFVKSLGELNDDLEDWDFKGKVPKAIRGDASDLRDLLKKDVLAEKITAKSSAEFLEEQHEYLSWMNDQVKKDSITVEQYHELRKAVRDYRGLVEMLFKSNPSADKKAVLDYLAILSKRMGQVKDGLLAEDRDSEDILQSLTRIDPDSKSELEQFLKMMAPYSQ